MRPFLAEFGRVMRGLEFVPVGPLDVIDHVAAVGATVEADRHKAGLLAMNRARSVMRASTSSLLSGGSLTVVIWVTTPLLSCISAMALSSWFNEDNALGGGVFPDQRSSHPWFGELAELPDRARLTLLK